VPYGGQIWPSLHNAVKDWQSLPSLEFLDDSKVLKRSLKGHSKGLSKAFNGFADSKSLSKAFKIPLKGPLKDFAVKGGEETRRV